MTKPDALKEVTQRLRDAVEEPGDVDALPAARDAAVARLAEALRTRGRSRRRQRMLRVPVLAAASFLLVAAGVFAVQRASRDGTRAATAPTTGTHELGRLVEPTPAVTALRNGVREEIAHGERVAAGTELTTSAASEARLEFESGTHVTLGGASRVRLVEQTTRKRFALEAGSLAARVAKLGDAERFVVATSDAEVEVRGTAFRVSVVPGEPSCAGGTPTRVDVSEGVVVVRHAGVQTNVAAGEHWPACGPSAVSPASITQETAPAVAASVRTSARASPARSLAAADVAPLSSSSHLAEQNDLFDGAMRRKRAGDGAGAVNQLDRLLTAYPAGPLAESAAAERMRLLLTADPQRAPVAARDYLAAHPHGFARAEAAAIAARPR